MCLLGGVTLFLGLKRDCSEWKFNLLEIGASRHYFRARRCLLCKWETRGSFFSFHECPKFGAKLLLDPQVWGKVPIGPSNLCQPIGTFPQTWGTRGVLSSRTDSVNVLLSSKKLNKIPQKHIQKLVYICGRANLSRNSLFGYVFIDLRTFENSASLSEGLRQPSHYSWIGRRQCYLVWGTKKRKKRERGVDIGEREGWSRSGDPFIKSILKLILKGIIWQKINSALTLIFWIVKIVPGTS